MGIQYYPGKQVNCPCCGKTMFESEYADEWVCDYCDGKVEMDFDDYNILD